MEYLHEAILKGSSRERNQALKTLYMDEVVNATVSRWSQACGLHIKEPDDILQEAMILLDEKIRNKSFKGQSTVKTYLLGICKRLIWESVKKKNIVDFKEHFQEGSENVKIPEYHHFDEIEKSETEKKRDEVLNNIIEEMKDNCKKVFRSYYFESKNLTQISEGMDVGYNMVKKTLHRCRKKLRSIIQNNPILLKLLKDLS